MSTILPYIELGNPDGEVIIFLSGFPDNQLSCWGSLIPEGLMKKYRLIFTCLPGFQSEKSCILPTWGYDVEELLNMLYLTVIQFSKSSLILVGHGIGATYCLLFENCFPNLVSKLILCDNAKPTIITINKLLSFDVYSILILVHALFFSISFIISRLLSNYLMDMVFSLFITPLFRIVMKVHTSKQTILARNCYVYYYWCKRLITNTIPVTKFPSCPLLFMYGDKKRFMFHDQEFIEQIKNTPHCRQYALNGGHWFMIDDPIATVQLIVAFLEFNSIYSYVDSTNDDSGKDNEPCNIE